MALLHPPPVVAQAWLRTSVLKTGRFVIVLTLQNSRSLSRKAALQI